MTKRWMLLLSMVAVGLLGSPAVQAQPNPVVKFVQDLMRCRQADTPARCRDALPACERAYQASVLLSASDETGAGSVMSLDYWARCEKELGLYAQAEGHLRDLLFLRQSRHGTEHADVANSLNNLAYVLESQGKYSEAEALYQKTLVMRQKVLGPEHPDVAQSLNNLASVLSRLGKYAEAETTFQEALVLRQKVLGPEHPDVAQSLNNLAYVLNRQGKYFEAETLYQKALTLHEKLLGPENPAVATSLNNLAYVLNRLGKYAEAETLYQKVLALRLKLLGPEHPHVARSLNNLASILEEQGKYSEAEVFFYKALALHLKFLGPEHPDVAISLSNLAGVLAGQGKFAEAEMLHKKALAMRQKLLGPEHPDVASSLDGLAGVLASQGKFAEAEMLHKKTLAMRQKLLGPEHPDVASALNNLAFVLSSQGKFPESETLLKQALILRQTLLGPGHPDVASSLNNLAGFYLGTGRQAQAVLFLRQAAAILEAQLRTTVSETRMQALLDTRRGEEDTIYGLLLRPDLPGAYELALQVALLRKGRGAAAGAVANMIVQRSLGRPEVARQFREWQGVRQQHEALLYGGMGALPLTAYRQRLQETKLQAEALEAQLASALPEIRALQPPKMDEIIAQVAAKLPARSALVEVVWTEPYQGSTSADGKVWGTPHYVALLLFPDRRIATVDLGEAATVDTLGQELRTALASPGKDPVPAAKRLYQQVMQRLQAQLGDVRDLYLSLDGTLNVIPFDALHDGTDYLLGRYRFHYLTSGRDLLREQSKRVASAPLVLANPEFGQVAATAKDGDKSLYSRLAGLPALPGTLRETQAIAPLLGIKPLVGAAAREEAVRASAAPRILHIATHGLFMQDVQLTPLPQNGEARGMSLLERERSKPVGVAEAERLPGALSAMNRSALVLADAARGAGTPDSAHDGLLTADEARSLDLDGTQLVVLSACETGRGGLSAGQGVYGLRRAFLVAGAETLVTSLWRVSDTATGELMTVYYQKLLDKKQPGDRLGAMVDAMQELRQKPGRSHPYYWAPFLVIGSDGPLRAAAR